MNPWISIWTEPRKTSAQICKANPNRSLWLLAWIYGFLSILNFCQSAAAGAQFHFLYIVLFTVVVAPLWGMIVFSVWSWVVLGIGKLLKGQANFACVRSAFAWSCVPLVVNIFLWALLLTVFQGTLFHSTQPSAGPMALMMFVLIAKLAVAIWSLVIYINALAEVQKFSIGRSIANIVIAWIAMGVAIALIWMGIAFLLHGTMNPSQAVLNITLGM